jgi:hypothetical protein
MGALTMGWLFLVMIACGAAVFTFAARDGAHKRGFPPNAAGMTAGALVVAVGIIGLVLSWGGAARAQAALYMPWGDLTAFLAEAYGERPIGGGEVSPDTVMVVFAAKGGASFTIAVRRAQGTACVVSGGKNWEPGDLPDEET